MLKSASGDSQIAIFGKGRINSPWVAKNFRMNGRCNCPTFLWDKVRKNRPAMVIFQIRKTFAEQLKILINGPPKFTCLFRTQILGLWRAPLLLENKSFCFSSSFFQKMGSGYSFSNYWQLFLTKLSLLLASYAKPQFSPPTSFPLPPLHSRDLQNWLWFLFVKKVNKF